MQLHLIYTKTQMLLSKKPYSSWRDIQKEFPGYKASLGPWTAEQVLEFIVDEYPNLEPSGSIQIDQVLASPLTTVSLKFKEAE